jgi:hypothetical protein
MTELERLVQAAEKMREWFLNGEDDCVVTFDECLASAKTELAALQAAGVTHPEKLKELFEGLDGLKQIYEHPKSHTLSVSESKLIPEVLKVADQCREKGDSQ